MWATRCVSSSRNRSTWDDPSRASFGPLTASPTRKPKTPWLACYGDGGGSPDSTLWIEIIIAEPCTPATIIQIIETARELDVEVLAVLGCHDEYLVPEAPVEYLGYFPVVAFTAGTVSSWPAY